jgi:RNA-binding protein YlmH
MMFDIITIFLVGLVLLFATYTALQLLGKFPRRTLDDVTPYLRPAELQEIQELLDPAQEVNFRLHLSPEEFRRWQRKRIHLMREYLLRMSHNALVLI